MSRAEAEPAIELIDPAEYEAGIVSRVREQDVAIDGIYTMLLQLRTYGISALSPPHPVDAVSTVVQVVDKIDAADVQMTAIDTVFLDQDLQTTDVSASWQVDNGLWKPLAFQLYNLRAQNQTKFGRQKRLSRAVFKEGYAQDYDNRTGPWANVAQELGLPK